MNKKYLAAAVVAGGMSLLPLANPASAATVDGDGKATIPIKLTVESGKTSSYDVMIGDAGGTGSDVSTGHEYILMTQKDKDSNEATVTSLTIQNKAQSAPVYIKRIKAEALNPKTYTVAPYSEDTFKTYDVDSKYIALKLKTVGASEQADLSTGWTGTEKIAAASSTTKELEGLMSLSTSTITQEHVANCVITLGLTGPAS